MTLFTARAVRGLEWVVADEVTALFAEAGAVHLSPRQVSFDLPAASTQLVRLRTADDVFVQAGIVYGVPKARSGLPHLADEVQRLDMLSAVNSVRAVRPIRAGPVLDVVASVAAGSRFSRFDVEEHIGTSLASMLAATYVPRRGERPPPPDLSVRVTLSSDRAEVALRLAERPLHRRAWKQFTGAGTLHPPAAAALLRLAGPSAWYADPFCGDGTVLVEAAMVAPGSLSFGADIDARRVANARGNAGLAGAAIELAQMDAARPAWRPVPGPGAVVTNPPWNRAVAATGRLEGSLSAVWAACLAIVEAGTVALIHEEGAPEGPGARPNDLSVILTQEVRLAGRVCRVTLAGRGATARTQLSPSLEGWRRRAIAEGVITASGF